jgi:hypothetical protein
MARSPVDPLAGRPGLRVDLAEMSALSRDLGVLAVKHGLQGCVLISFGHERMGVTTCARSEVFARHMERFGDRLLAAIDDGQFDPEEACDA